KSSVLHRVDRSSPGESVTQEEREATRAYLEAISARGVGTFLANGGGLDWLLETLGDRPVPVLVSDGRAGKPANASPIAAHLDYPVHEIGRRRGAVLRRGLDIAARPVAATLRAIGFDRVAYVNHWLFPSAEPLPPEPAALAALIESVARRFPRHAVVLPGVVPALSPDLALSLCGLGGRAIPSHVVHLQRPGRAFPGKAMRAVRHNRNADFAVHGRHAAQKTTDPAFLAKHSERLSDLYRGLYLERHPAHLNPQFTPEFFRLLVESGAFEVAGWTGASGELDAFNIRLVRGGVTWWTIGGYDTRLPHSLGLYRLIAIDDIVNGEVHRLVVNAGSGNGDFKRRRGAEPATEFAFVFTGHLPRSARLPWQVLERARRVRLAGQGLSADVVAALDEAARARP
ncbi:MAG: hypothetical protein ACKO2K_21840, partial [Alphaproteobacteria bacterium]